MNVDFRSDQVAFENFIRGRELARLFNDRVLADRVFQAATEAAASVAHVEHQRAVFELNHPAGNVYWALSSLQKAEAATEYGKQAIQHTRAMALRKLALVSESDIEKDRFRSEASSIVKRLIRQGGSSHPCDTLAQLRLDELKDRIESLRGGDKTSDVVRQKQVADLVGEIERVLADGLERFPGEGYLLELEAQLSRIVSDEPRAVGALERANVGNPGNGFISVRLARCYRGRGDREGAKAVLVRCLEQNSTSREAHVELGKLLSEEDAVGQKDSILQHFRRGFAPGDTNYDAQFWYARHEFLYGDADLARRTFGEQPARLRI